MQNIYRDVEEMIEAMCRHGGEFSRADDFGMRQVGFVSHQDDSRFLLPISYILTPGPLVLLFRLQTPSDRDKFVQDLSKDPAVIMQKIETWRLGQDVI